MQFIYIFSPSINLNSGKTASLLGTGPPLLFSPGLFGIMPGFIYNELLSNLKNNFTIVTMNSLNPLSPNDIKDISDSLSVESIGLLGHSSFNPKILETSYINKAVLLDPICLPDVNMYSFNSKEINIDYPILIIKSDKLYNNNPSIPDWQNPIFKNEVEEIVYENVGHPDILDDRWANLAKSNGFWETTNGDKQNFLEWKFDKNSISKIRKEYRDYVANECKNFILKEQN